MSIERKYDPTTITDYVSEYYPLFGVKQFHDVDQLGKGIGTTDAYRVKVFLIDSGFDDNDPGTAGVQTHVDLSGVTVIDFSVEGSPEIPSHGSLVSSLVAAPINSFGIVGICPEADIYLADVDNSSGDIFQSKVAEAIEYAVTNTLYGKMDIISMSLGSTSFTSSMKNAVNLALSQGILVFASAGNSGSPGYEYPASFDGVISVGSVDIDGNLSTFNTQNEKIALFAPGENYYLPSNVGPVRANGTSYSCPFAAGLAALYISKERETRNDPGYMPTREEIVTILEGPTYLNSAGLSYPVVNGGGITVEDSLAGGTLYVVIAIVVVFLVVGIIGYTMASKPPTPEKESK